MTTGELEGAGEPGRIGERLNEILASLGEKALEPALAARFGAYAALLVRWNARMNLTAVRDEEGTLRRHFVESIACARLLPSEIPSLLDFGSGAGLPGIPIALCRGEIAVTLAESQGKKAAFLHEAARVLDLKVRVHGGRAELMGEHFGCVTLRAVDRMGDAVRIASGLVANGGWLALLTTVSDESSIRNWAEGAFEWSPAVVLPGASERILLLGRRPIVPRGTIQPRSEP
jgi:16S rRNA (guanine527-N7)-methyltransferase